MRVSALEQCDGDSKNFNNFVTGSTMLNTLRAQQCRMTITKLIIIIGIMKFVVVFCKIGKIRNIEIISKNLLTKIRESNLMFYVINIGI